MCAMSMCDVLGLVMKPSEQGPNFGITIKVTLINSVMALRDIMGQKKYTTTTYMHVFLQSLGSIPSLIRINVYNQMKGYTIEISTMFDGVTPIYIGTIHIADKASGAFGNCAVGTFYFPIQIGCISTGVF
jgi:hypothetical protein